MWERVPVSARKKAWRGGDWEGSMNMRFPRLASELRKPIAERGRMHEV